MPPGLRDCSLCSSIWFLSWVRLQVFGGEVLWWGAWEEGKLAGVSASLCFQECPGGVTYNVLWDIDTSCHLFCDFCYCLKRERKKKKKGTEGKPLMRRGNVNCGWRWQCTIRNFAALLLYLWWKYPKSAAQQTLSSERGWCFQKSSWSLKVLLNSRENTNTEPRLDKIVQCLSHAANRCSSPIFPRTFPTAFRQGATR